MSKTLEALQAKQKALSERIAKVKAAAQAIEARQRSRQAGLARRQDTRRKILIGSMYLDEMTRDEEIKARVMKRLSSFLTREDDRALFGLAGGTKPATKER
jgi:hypothetical protein